MPRSAMRVSGLAIFLISVCIVSACNLLWRDLIR